jgi:putative membrane protein
VPARLTRRLVPNFRRSAFDAYALRRLILRDYLAIERTRLANERTALSYLRTTLAMTAGALTLLHLVPTPAARITAWTLLTFGALLIGFGLYRFVAVRRRVVGYARLHQPRPGRRSAPEEEAAE